MAKRKTKNRHMPVSKAKTAYELLGEIRKLILEEPLRYDQEKWLDVGCLLHDREPKCGTVGCVAGWVVALKEQRTSSAQSVIKCRAMAILGIEVNQANWLFS